VRSRGWSIGCLHRRTTASGGVATGSTSARYADSDGYEKDTGRPFAWRFRDWVIAALNADMPFDRFTVEQLAGDLVPNSTIETKTATGFHRNTLTNKEGGVDQEEYRVAAVVDRVNTTGKVWLGLTVGCAQCHDHKYDPVSQREFYQLFAFFNSDKEADIAAPLPGEEEKVKAAKAKFDAKLADLKNAVEEGKAKKLPDAEQTKRTKTLAAHEKNRPRREQGDDAGRRHGTPDPRDDPRRLPAEGRRGVAGHAGGFAGVRWGIAARIGEVAGGE